MYGYVYVCVYIYTQDEYNSVLNQFKLSANPGLPQYQWLILLAFILILRLTEFVPESHLKIIYI